jgi:HrpA-like RNA helicase
MADGRQEGQGQQQQGAEGEQTAAAAAAAAIGSGPPRLAPPPLPPLGAVLVFLPGVSEIMELLPRLADLPGILPLPLHSTLEPAQQEEALLPAKPGLRKVVLSTNVGESSITLPDVSYVIDLGLEKVRMRTLGHWHWHSH